LDNIKMDIREIGWDVMDWIDLTQDRDEWRVLVNTVINFRIPQNVEKFLSSFSRRVQLHEHYNNFDKHEIVVVLLLNWFGPTVRKF
jgi:hypothetical protein